MWALLKRLTLLKRFILPQYHKPFSFTPEAFTLHQLWREAFKQSRPFWIKLLVADAMVLMMLYLPFWMPLMAQYFPFLKAFTIHPDFSKFPHFFQVFTAWSKAFFYYFYWILVGFPFYLALNLFGLRIAYRRRVEFDLITHYFSYFWWLVISQLFTYVLILVIPWGLFFYIYAMKAQAQGHMMQVYSLGTVLFVTIMLGAVFLSFSFSLIFGARIAPIKAFVMSFKGVKTCFWRIVGMLMLLHLVQQLGYKTYYLSDIILMPPSVVAWALLYKKIFGEPGLTE